MKKTYLAVSALLMLTVTACGADKPTLSAQTTNTSVSTANNTTVSNSDGNVTSAESAPAISLSSFTEAKSSGISVSTPTGWDVTPIQGGDYMGWELTNPKDSSQKIKIIRSSCVGCTMASDGSVQAKLAIPVKVSNITSTSDSNHVVNYTFSPKSSTNNTNNMTNTTTGSEITENEGTGMVVVSHDSSGYGSIEVVLPASESAIAKQVISSFEFSH